MTLLSASFFERDFHGKGLVEIQEHPNDSETTISSVHSLKNQLTHQGQIPIFFYMMVVLAFILDLLKKFIKGLGGNWRLCWQGSAWRLCSRCLGTPLLSPNALVTLSREAQLLENVSR